MVFSSSRNNAKPKLGLDREIFRYNNLIEQNAPFSKRLELAQLQNYIKED